VSVPHIAPGSLEALESAERYFESEVRPKAQEIDQSIFALTAAFEGLAAAKWLGLRVPQEYGGKGFADPAFRRFQEIAARCSGALAFLQTQHQSAASFIVKSDNEDLKRRTLPKLATGELTAGIAFAQLRRHGAPMLTADRVRDGYVLRGNAPWITGWGIFGHCVTAAKREDGTTLFVWHRLAEEGGFTATQPMHLAAMEVVQTVSGKFEKYFIPEADVLYIRPGNWIEENDLINISLQAPFALGCAQAGVDILRSAFEKKKIPAIADAADALAEELARCRDEAYGAMENQGDTQRSLEARAWAIDLAGRSAHAAVAASSGAGNSFAHPAQRVYREALVFTVSAQTIPILEATLRRMTR
jgi:alkylation response protein AidB-like acyl-CoA dehydrogenase